MSILAFKRAKLKRVLEEEPIKKEEIVEVPAPVVAEEIVKEPKEEVVEEKLAAPRRRTTRK